MKDRRIISFVLALVMSFNFSISAFAENAEGTESMSGLQKHTVTITAGEKTGKLTPLTSAGTTLNDRGGYLQNAEGVVETQVQSVYYPNQKHLRKRNTIVEHPYGTVKRWHGAGYLLTKGKVKVAAEMGLSFLAYNFRRVINLLGIEGTMNMVKA